MFISNMFIFMMLLLRANEQFLSWFTMWYWDTNITPSTNTHTQAKKHTHSAVRQQAFGGESPWVFWWERLRISQFTDQKFHPAPFLSCFLPKLRQDPINNRVCVCVCACLSETYRVKWERGRVSKTDTVTGSIPANPREKLLRALSLERRSRSALWTSALLRQCLSSVFFSALGSAVPVSSRSRLTSLSCLGCSLVILAFLALHQSSAPGEWHKSANMKRLLFGIINESTQADLFTQQIIDGWWQQRWGQIWCWWR